jgi:hypothetical protein
MDTSLALSSESDVQHVPARIEVLTAGANRGTRLMQPAIGAFNRASTRFALTPVYVDPVPERAATLAREGVLHGIGSRSIEARIEEVLPARSGEHFPLIVSVDNPHAVATALEAASSGQRPVLVYFLVRMPNEELLGIRAVLQEGDVENQRIGARFFRKLGEVTARSGASAVVGNQGRPEHLALEPAYRAWFAEHMNANMTKLVAHTQPESDPFEVTTDGRKTMSLMLKDSTSGWTDPSDLARAIVEHPSMPITRGRDFAVGEIGPDGVRLHVLRVRATDGKAAINASAIVSPDAYRAADAERRDAIRRQLAEAVARAERQTVSRTRPIFTTD